jgi:hypothetical protein
MGVAELSTKVVAQVAGKALASEGIPGGAAVIEPLLRDLLQIQDEQAVAITRIDANVQRLIDGPWETARTYVEEAALAPPEQRADKLRAASTELHRAVPLQPDGTLQRAYACLDLALVERLLGDDGSSALQAQHALQAATASVMRELEALKELKKAKRRSVGLAVGSPFAAKSGLTVLKLHSHRREFPMVWHEFGEIRDAATTLCGDSDTKVQQCQEHVTAEIAKLGLAKLVTKLAAIDA